MGPPISDEALEAAERAAGKHHDLRAAIEAFMVAEGFVEERTNVVSDTQRIERRLVGRWSEVS